MQNWDPTETVCLTNDGWKWLDQGATEAGTLGAWTLHQVFEMVEFVVTNGYINRGGRLRHQLRGFGKGLPCAPQLANLACYPVEADFANKCQPKKVEINFRFFHDILTLKDVIPTEGDAVQNHMARGWGNWGRRTGLGWQPMDKGEVDLLGNGAGVGNKERGHKVFERAALLRHVLPGCAYNGTWAVIAWSRMASGLGC